VLTRAALLIGTALITGNSTASGEVDACLDLGGAWDDERSGCVFGDVDHACGLLLHHGGAPAFEPRRETRFWGLSPRRVS
jgi:hypothetical protein